MAKWVQPSSDNVKALWRLIKEGRFRNADGVPKFQVTKGIDDRDEIILSWAYDNDKVVRCSIDNIPVYLSDEPTEDVHKILKFIAKRDLRPPKHVDELALAPAAAQRYAEEAEKIFLERILATKPDSTTQKLATDAFRDTLRSMLSRKMIKGT